MKILFITFIALFSFQTQANSAQYDFTKKEKITAIYPISKFNTTTKNKMDNTIVVNCRGYNSNNKQISHYHGKVVSIENENLNVQFIDYKEVFENISYFSCS